MKATTGFIIIAFIIAAFNHIIPEFFVMLFLLLSVYGDLSEKIDRKR